MTLLVLFLGLFLGLVLVGDNVIFFSLLSVLIFIFILKRFKRIKAYTFLIAFIVGVAISFINLRLNPSEGTYLGLVIEAKDNYFVVLSKFERLYVYQKGNTQEVGNIVRISGSISNLIDTSLESEFSFIHYLNNLGITRQINVTEISNVFTNFIRLQAFRKYFLNLFDTNARNYVDAFLFNIKNYDSSSTQLVNSLNLVSLFSSSGIYLSLILGINEYLLFLKLNRKHARLGSLLLLSWYFLVAFNKISVRRILYVKLFSYINEYHLKKKFTHIEIISLVGIMMLSLNHYLARQEGFYLGFIISIAFYFVSTSLSTSKRSLLISKTSIFIYFLLLPVLLINNHELHIFGVFYQSIISPFCFTFILLSIIALYTYPIRPLFNFGAFTLDKILSGIKVIDIKLPFKEFSAYYLFVYYLLLFSILYFNESYSKRKVIKIAVAGVLLLSIKVIPFEYLYADSITFLNVGQGDSALIRHLDKNILIDTGGLTYKDIATNVTIPYLNKHGIYQLDYVFLSHSDYDHSGALDSLKNNFKVKVVVDTSEPFSYSINGLTIQNINEWANQFKDENDKSQVLTFNVANRNFLMMGDISSDIERKIMDKYSSLSVDVVKLAHHGSSTSNSYDFLKFINPSEAIISVGKNNIYHHPNEEVIKTLNLLHIPYFRTDEVGSVHYDKYAILTT